MHTYVIDKNIRNKVIIFLFGFSIVLSSVLTLVLGKVIQDFMNLLKIIEWVNEILLWCDKLGVTMNFIGIPFLYTFSYWIYDKCIWKWKIVRKIHKVPDLNGCWKGTLISQTYQTRINMKLEIQQTWSMISFVTKFPQSTSESNTATIRIEQGGIVKVEFGYINRSREVSQQYDGYNIIELDDENHIFGRYFNNRDNINVGYRGGNIGTFELVKSL